MVTFFFSHTPGEKAEAKVVENHVLKPAPLCKTSFHYIIQLLGMRGEGRRKVKRKMVGRKEGKTEEKKELKRKKGKRMKFEKENHDCYKETV